MAESAVRSKGWNLTTEGFTLCLPSDGNHVSAEKVIDVAKNTDLREIGEKWLPDELNRGKCEYVEGPGVLQIQKIRNISAPKEHEESQTAPRMLRLTMTDGQQTCNAIEMQRLDRIGLDTAPGTKICIKGTVEVENGFLLLTNKNTIFVGGRVNKLAENWELKKMLAGQSRANVGSEGGPPLFVPFGQRIRDGRGAVQVNKRDNFKSIESNKKEEKTAEEIEFEEQRKAVIAEALQAKEEGKPKTFGGGTKQVGMDREISRIVEMGFTAEEASRALRQNDNDVTSAINQLLSGRRNFRDRPMSDRGDRRGPQRDFREDRQDNRRDDRRNDRREDRRDDRRDDKRDDRRENTKGGRGRGREREDFGEDMGSSRPSGPATLFDFLETKIKPSNDKSSNPQTEKNSSQSSSSSYTKSQNQYSTNQNQRNNDSDFNKRYQGNNRNDDPPSKNYRGGKESRPQTGPASVSKAQNSQKSSYHNNQNNEKTSARSNISNERGKQSYSNQPGNQRVSNSQNNYNNAQFNSSRIEDRGGQNNSRGTFDNSGNSSDSNRQSRPVKSQGYNKRDNPTISSQNYNTQSSAQSDSRQYGGQNGNKHQGQSESKTYGSQNDSRQYGRNENRQFGQNNSRQYSGSQSECRQYGQSESRHYSAGSRSEQYRSDETPSGREQNFDSKRNKEFGKGPQNSQPMRQPNESSNQRGNNRKNYQNQSQNFSAPSTSSFKKGDPCLAKYWEDNKFYPAVVQALYPDLPTCIVLFTEYGNEEEVNLTDVKPLSMLPSQYLPHQQQPQQQQYMDYGGHQQGHPGPDNHINSMEFRRRPTRTEPSKPTQAFYQPPSQRH
ncbi:tudor domain-containing protein 3-like [Ylistrum balloti]|uniref:tudor domain-containing protein 3-like n=1 Tax=Ylistrum balloti TaxID=509963 RepID=UPI002905BDF2|nr:tudor domain-containing protein 3-like [Ylistrum balloti]